MPLVSIQDLEQDEEILTPFLKEAGNLYGYYHTWLEKQTGNVHDRAPGIHASEISGCQRKVVYSLRGEEKVQQAETKMKKVFEVGHLMHDLLQKDFGKFANSTEGRITFKKEIPIDPFTNKIAGVWQIYSSADGLFTFWGRSKKGLWVPTMRVLIEIKSMNPDDFKSLTKPDPDHIEQSHVYMACLDVPLTWLVYYNKSNINMTQSGGSFLVPFNHRIWEGLEKRFEVAHDHVSLGTLPDREEGFPCNWCPYSHTCSPEVLKKKFRKPPLLRP